MKAQPALVRAERAVHLHAESPVDLDLATVVLPRDSEHDHPLGLHEPLDDLRPREVGTARDHEIETVEHFFDGLMEFGFGGIPGMHLRQDVHDIWRDRRARGSTDEHLSSLAEPAIAGPA